jgi:hypothetical protein
MCFGSSRTQSTEVGIDAKVSDSNVLRSGCVLANGDQSFTVPSLDEDSNCCLELLYDKHQTASEWPLRVAARTLGSA